MYLYKIKDSLRSLKWRIQRFKKGYADIDLWSLDSWFLKIMPKMLLEFSEKMNGCPMDMEFKEWEKYLTDMATHFQEAYKIYDLEYKEKDEYKKLCDNCVEEFHKGIKMFEERFFNFWY